MSFTSLFKRNKANDGETVATNEEDQMSIASDVAAPDANQGAPPVLALKVQPKHDSIGIDSSLSNTQICATITACDLPEDQERAPVDLVVALDISASMNGSKLKLCKETLELLIRVLQKDDRFGLVIYGSHASVSVPVRSMTEDNKRRALGIIQGIRTSGMTNLSGGLSMAAQEINSISNPNKVQAIFLLTDGHANQGVTDEAGLVSLTKSIQNMNSPNRVLSAVDEFVVVEDDAKQPAPIPVHCFGYGGDHNSDILQAISDASGGGSYYFVDSDSNVKSAFGDAMGGMLSVVAQSAVVTLRVPKHAAEMGVTITKVHHNEATKQDDGSFTVPVGDFYAEESRDILMDVELAKTVEGEDFDSVPIYIPHVEATISYTSVVSDNFGIVKSNPVTCFISRPEGNDVSVANDHITLQSLRIMVAQEIELASNEARINKLQAARDRLSAAISTIQKDSVSFSKDLKPLVDSMISDIHVVLENFSSMQQYQTCGAHHAKRKVKSNLAQRCAEANLGDGTFYRTAAKTRMALNFQSAKTNMEANFKAPK